MIPFGLAFKAAQIYAGAQLLDLELDVGAVARWGYRLTRVASGMQASADAIDQRALDEMVALAQSRVPRRTGKLSAGITGEREDDAFVFKAEAQRDASSADYSPYVERGTRPGRRGQVVAEPTSFERRAGIRRRSRRSHPGTEAQPFFYNSAREVLERRNVQQGAALVRQTAEDAET